MNELLRSDISMISALRDTLDQHPFRTSVKCKGRHDHGVCIIFLHVRFLMGKSI